jgi:hypothetical protein
MKSIHRSILTRALMTGVASLAFMMVTAGGVRAETVIVRGADGAAGVMGGDPISGGDGESVAASPEVCIQSRSPKMKARRPAEMVAKAASASSAPAAAEMAGRPLRKREPPSLRAQREQTLILSVEMAAWAEEMTLTAASFLAASAATAEPQLRRRRQSQAQARR